MLINLSNWSVNKSQKLTEKALRESIGTTLIDRVLYTPKQDSELTTEQLGIRQRIRDIQHEPDIVPRSTELPRELKIAMGTINYTTDKQNG